MKEYGIKVKNILNDLSGQLEKTNDIKSTPINLHEELGIA